MALILEWQPRLQKTDTLRTDAKVRPDSFARGAKVIIFSGVRYERMPDVSSAIIKSTKKSRKIA